MTNIKKRDFKIDARGDLVLGSADNRYMAETSGVESLMQTVKVRIMSSDPDVPDSLFTDFCANLEDLIGMPNTYETAELGMSKIRQSLTIDGLVSGEDLFIRPTVVSKEMIAFFVFIKKEGIGTMYLEVLLNLEVGVQIGRERYDIER